MNVTKVKLFADDTNLFLFDKDSKKSLSKGNRMFK